MYYTRPFKVNRKLPGVIILDKKNVSPISFEAFLKGKNLSPRVVNCFLQEFYPRSRKTNKKSQKSFPIEKMDD